MNTKAEQMNRLTSERHEVLIQDIRDNVFEKALYETWDIIHKAALAGNFDVIIDYSKICAKYSTLGNTKSHEILANFMADPLLDNWFQCKLQDDGVSQYISWRNPQDRFTLPQ